MIDLKNMKVLVADDMENMYTSIRRIMRLLEFGRHFTYACNGEEAYKKLQAEAFDLAILDNNMPQMTGLELLQVIREDPALRDMPIIMITAHAEQEFIANAAESEIDAYILKPITVKLLQEKIPMVIERANNPSPMVVHLKNAFMAAEAGDYDKAIEEAGIAAKENPDSSRPLRELGKYYLEKGSFDTAEKLLLKAAKMNDIDVVAFHHLGDLYLKQENYDNAMKYFNKAVEISPRNFERGLNLGRLLIKKGMPDKAMPVFRKVFELSKNTQELKEEIADLCYQEGEYGYASKLFSDVLIHNKERGDILYKLGVMYHEQGKLVEALEQFEEAENFDRANIDMKIRIAKIYFAQGMIIRAERPLKDVLKLDPNHEEARDMLRQCI